MVASTTSPCISSSSRSRRNREREEQLIRGSEEHRRIVRADGSACEPGMRWRESSRSNLAGLAESKPAFLFMAWMAGMPCRCSRHLRPSHIPVGRNAGAISASSLGCVECQPCCDGHARWFCYGSLRDAAGRTASEMPRPLVPMPATVDRAGLFHTSRGAPLILGAHRQCRGVGVARHFQSLAGDQHPI